MAINIPLVQVDAQSPMTPSALARLFNQLQTNIINGIYKLQNGLDPVTSSIGDIQLSALSLSQFQDLRGPGWVLANGQSASGSQYQKITGKGTVPNQVSAFTGISPYIRIN